MKTLRQANIHFLSIAGLLTVSLSNNLQAQLPACVTSLSYQEGFNNATLSNCFAQQQVSSASSSYDAITPISNSQSPTIQAPYEGTHMLRFRSSFIPNGIKRRLVTSPFNTTNASNINVAFQWYEGNPNSSATNDYPTEGVQVQYSYDGSTWHDAGSFVSRFAAQSPQWSLKSITLPAAAEGQSNVYIGFVFSSNNGFNCYLDALQITANTGNPATSCAGPVPAAVTAIGSNTAQINWTSSNSQYSELFYSQSSTAPGAATAATQSNVLNNNYVLSNLNANTTYYTWVRNYCGSNNYSNWAAAAPFTTLCNAAQQPNAGSIQGNDQLCTGATATLTATVSGGTWSSSNTSVATINASGLLTANNAGSTTITYSISNSCGTATATKAITVNQNSPVTDINGSESICAGTQAQYSNATSGGSWESLNPAIATITSSGLLTALQSGTVTIKYAKTQNCGIAAKTKTITIAAKPTLTGIQATETANRLNYNFEAQNVQNAGTYLWNFGDGQTSNSSNPNHTYASSGSYTVTLCITNSCQQTCTNTDNYKQYNLNTGTTSINTKYQHQSVSVFPNPVQDNSITLRVDLGIDNLSDIGVYDMTGNKMNIRTEHLSGNSLRIDVADMAQGVYLLQYSFQGRQAISRIVKTR